MQRDFDSIKVAFEGWRHFASWQTEPLMYKVEIPQDNLTTAAIHRRQQLDHDRKLRIFNPKVRTMGV